MKKTSDYVQHSGGKKIEGKFSHKIEDKTLSDEELAEIFHNEYEKAAKAYSWNTQEKCKTDFYNLPENNRKTMIATVIQVRKIIEEEARRQARSETAKEIFADIWNLEFKGIDDVHFSEEQAKCIENFWAEMKKLKEKYGEKK